MTLYLISRLLLLQLGSLALGVNSLSPLGNGKINLRHLQDRAAGGCDALSTALPDHVYWPNSSQYLNQSQDVWSQTCVMTPQCVFEPSTVSALSQGLKIIREAGTKFAFRAGGHMPVPGAQSLNDGVMISASMFNTNNLSADGSIASIGPGQTWMEVYQWLAPYGLAVNGGRFPSVGVGGLLVGGGMGYFSGSQGWAVDNIVGWQVVLWNGTVLEVTNSAQDPHADLAWGLKGGSNLFGLVTRFDVRTFPATSAFGGLTIWSGEAGSDVLSSLTSYMTPGGGVDDPNVHIDVFSGISFNNSVPTLSYYNIALYPGGQAGPTALENFTAIPADMTLSNGVAVHESWTAIPQQLDSFSTRALRNLFYAISFEATAESISLYNQTIIENAVSMLSNVEGLSTYAVYQPVSKKYLQASKDKGSNVLGLDPDVDGTFIAGIILSMWKNAEDDATVLEFSRTSAQQIRQKTEALGLYNKFIYLGDSAQGQSPFESYANGKNLQKLNAIRSRYDPDSFLENYLHRGFQLA
ncbi:FAD-binding domain-containing protein [Annulohypoxylon maeteangense]|uniref:FAD-binding domain-containing protein n=1 Tax=Annulohypoxylon maeteangense TaxID=1927788 RepID=UPI00200787E7|nr:FAD-binding domain-containing protein [Annulohypoxylon maeteangense]KAI0883026.1 FAD-binding domain-containing protein [Annulohypoxylon maeteangense]